MGASVREEGAGRAVMQDSWSREGAELCAIGTCRVWWGASIAYSAEARASIVSLGMRA